KLVRGAAFSRSGEVVATEVAKEEVEETEAVTEAKVPAGEGWGGGAVDVEEMAVTVTVAGATLLMAMAVAVRRRQPRRRRRPWQRCDGDGDNVKEAVTVKDVAEDRYRVDAWSWAVGFGQLEEADGRLSVLVQNSEFFGMVRITQWSSSRD
ncbi:Protein of unknown function, partial [Gryllus bimaculatus]